ncbi:hypothetical protein IFR05_017364, partial [Cadophora sp. M221]
MTKFNPEMEARMVKAIAFRQDNPHIKPFKIAAKFVVILCLFNARFRGRKPQSTKGGQNKALSPQQNEALREYISFLIFCGHQATKSSIRCAANSILRSSHSIRIVNQQWADRWFKSNKKWYKTLRAKTL